MDNIPPPHFQTPEEIIARLDKEVTALRNALVFAASWIESGRPLEGLAERMREAAKAKT